MQDPQQPADGAVNTRRRFLQQSSALVAAAAFSPSLRAFAARPAGTQMGVSPYGPLFPTRDKTTGLDLLKLPRGFTYRSYGWTGDVMSDGTLTPDRHDGMAIVTAPSISGETVLIRNHERGGSEPGNPLPVIGNAQTPTYDPVTIPGALSGLGGGTTSMTFRNGKLVDSRATLAGTLTNCAGGATPWGSWLTCEEVTILGSAIGARDHGFVFEVPDPALGPASARPIREMGLMDHEAVAVDPSDGRVYLTEDNGPKSGFYRFTPNDTSMQIGSLENGGALEMLKVVGQNNAALELAEQGDVHAVEWVPIADPTAGPEFLEPPAPGFPPIGGAGRSGPYMQGEAFGGASFRRGEGCWTGGDGVIYFVDTSGGAAGKGAVWAYDPVASTLTALFVSPGEETADNPDNLAISPNGGILVCEDGGGFTASNGEVVGTRMLGIGQDGSSFVFAENNMVIDQPLPGRPFIAPDDYRSREWCGACFDPFGRYLYVNIQTPGVTFVVRGPWSRGSF